MGEYQLQALWVSLGMSTNLGLPCIYDSIILARPECNFREGIKVKANTSNPNSRISNRKYLEELRNEESLVLGIMANLNLDYSTLTCSKQIKDEILSNSQGEAAIGLASTLILV